MSDNIPQIDESKLDDYGTRLFNLFLLHEADRKSAEERWLQNMRQFRGIYDPDIRSMIPDDCSKAYPKLTRKVVVGTGARLMQMLFPQTEENFGVKNSPMPDLSKDQLQEVLDAITQLAAGEDGDPADVVLKDEDIEKAIQEYAAQKAERMELKVKDDLKEMEYITLARRVVFSGALYNIGVLAGPYNIKVPARIWRKNENTGKYEAQEVEKYKPVYEFRTVWDHYPDMTAKTLDKQDGAFDRHIMTRQQVEELTHRADFLGDRITEWLQKNVSGNYQAKWWETVIKGEPKSDQVPVTNKESRKYELYEYWGAVTGHDLRAAGVTVPDADIGKSFEANVWIIGKTVIKAKLAPFDNKIKHHHYFVFEEDDLSLLGNGQCDTMRDSQLSLCEVTRAMLDDASVVGPMAIVNDDLLVPGQSDSIRKHKTWHVEDVPSNQSLQSAVSNVNVESQIPRLLMLRNAILEFASEESGLPPPSLGDVSKGGSEALRTQGNASMFLGAAALPVRDTVRNFDSFTISFISSVVAWNMKFDPNPSRDGDHNIIARGSTSLIAKEVLGQSLDAVRQTLSPDEIPHIKTRKLLEMRLKARDVPIDELMEEESVAMESVAQQQAAQQKMTAQQEALVEAKVHETLSRAVSYIAKAHKDDASIATDAATLLLEALSKGHENAIKEKQTTKPEVKQSGDK